MDLESFLKNDIADFLDMLSRAAIEHDKRSEQEIERILSMTSFSDKQAHSMQSFFSGSLDKGQSAATPGLPAAPVIQAQNITIQQPVSIPQPMPNPALPQQTSTQAPATTQPPQPATPEETLPSTPVQESPNQEQPSQPLQQAQAQQQRPSPQSEMQHENQVEQRSREPSLPVPGLVKNPNEREHRIQRLASQDLPFGSSNITADYELSGIDHYSKRKELTVIAKCDEKIKQMHTFIKEKRYGKAMQLHRELQDFALSLQYHPQHRQRLLHLLMDAESTVLKKQALLTPLKKDYTKMDDKELAEEDDANNKKHPFHQTVYRVTEKTENSPKTPSPKAFHPVVVEKTVTVTSQATDEADQKTATKQKDYDRFAQQKYLAGLYALRHQDYLTAKRLFSELVQERPQNKAYKVRLTQSLAGVYRGN